MEDWRSYDAIAEDYRRIWAPRFEWIARHLLALAPSLEGAWLIDLGAGTGALCAALGDKLGKLSLVVGCDVARDAGACRERSGGAAPDRHRRHTAAVSE